MAKAKAQVETPEVEESTDEVIMTPKALAEVLNISPKTLRTFLRKKFPRSTEEKNTSWSLSQDHVEAATKNFTAAEVDSDEE